MLSFLAFIPIFFLPFTQDFYELNKWYAVILLAVIALIFWSLKAARSGKTTLHVGPAVISLLFLAAAGGVSLLAASPNKVEAALSPFGPLLFVALAMLAAWPWRNTEKLLTLLLHSISILGGAALLQLTGIPAKIFAGTSWLADPLWTPAGGTLTLLGLLAISLPLLFARAKKAHETGNQMGMVGWGVQLLIVVAALIATTAVAVPKLSSMVLPLSASWQVMLETLKRFPATLVGVGPENFLTAFTAGRAPALNMTPVWNTRFLASSSTLLHLGTTTGIIGLLALAVLLLRLIPRSLGNALDWSRLLTAVALILLPPSVSLIVAAGMLLLISEPEKVVGGHVRHGRAAVVAALGIIAAFALGYLLFRTYSAELAFFRAYLTEQHADGGAVQRAGQRAIVLNPYVARFHEAYAQTNLLLAAAIAQQATAGQTFTEEDRQVVSQLVSQAVREGKLATQLHPTQVTSWETLGRLYQSLIGMADGAESWAVASFQKAIELDPTNPGLRMELASIYLAQNNADAAIAHFAIAAALKPDFTNAHYNLANAQREKGNLSAARDSLLKAQSLLAEGSSDYEQITRELEAIEASASAATQ